MALTVRQTIIATVEDVVLQTSPGAKVKLEESTVLLESGLDSLAFAVLVARLEDDLGYDPFSLSDTPFYPVTFGEFVRFYEENQPK